MFPKYPEIPHSNYLNFAVTYPWNLLFSKKVAYFLTVSIIFSVYKYLKNNLKTRTAMNVKTLSVQCLIFFKRPYICYCIICMTGPLSKLLFLGIIYLETVGALA